MVHRYIAERQAGFLGLVAGTRIARRLGAATDYSALNVGPRIIVFRETEDILVVRILHKAMDAEQPLQP